ncbi:MAG: hypothetical protein SWH78_10665 [Thermodesulfobacteriota bacterium]|nr:hypothetical protein [Thermodesulfobacteriota bacterium]
MKGKRLLGVWTLAFLGVAGLFALTWAGDDIKTRAMLRGLGPISVEVEHFDLELRDRLKRGGLTEDGLLAAVERKLQAAGIRLLSDEDSQKAPFPPVLYVNLQILVPEVKFTYTVGGEQISKEKSGERHFYRVDVELRQMASLLRDPLINGEVATWSSGSMGFRRLPRIQADVMDQVDAFISACSGESTK